MCSGSGSHAVQRDQTPYRASLRKPALARAVGYLYTAVDLCQMHLELDGIVIFMVKLLITYWRDLAQVPSTLPR
jgi:hypothetical protein